MVFHGSKASRSTRCAAARAVAVSTFWRGTVSVATGTAGESFAFQAVAAFSTGVRLGSRYRWTHSSKTTSALDRRAAISWLR